MRLMVGHLSLIEIRNLAKLYRMGDSVVRALNGVDLDIERGEFVAIIGPSGSGKSTMMHLLGCLDRPTGGSFVFNGRDVGKLSDRDLAIVRNREIGFVFQTFNLINRTTALANVGVPLFYSRQVDVTSMARVALERVGLKERARHKPNELSGGERQRVAIARAIVNNPLLLLADEPTGNLDTRTGEQIMEIFHSLNRQGVTIVVVTHEPDIAVQARRIVAMRDGKIVSDETSEQYAERMGLRILDPAAAASAGGDAPGGPALGALPVRPPTRTSVPAAAVDLQVNGASGEIHVADPTVAARAVSGSGAALAHESDLQLSPQMARGATTALVLAITGCVISVGLWFTGSYLVAASGGAATLKPGQMPPAPVLAGIGLVLLSLVNAIGLGAVAVLWGRSVLKRVRREPGNWLGVSRAKWGVALGGVMLAAPFLLFILSLAMKLLS
jgi:putative ABC transport system ATP-binding protein